MSAQQCHWQCIQYPDVAKGCRHASLVKAQQSDAVLPERHSSAPSGGPLQASSALRKEEAAEAGRELRALLRLLTNLTQRDLLDFGSSPDGPKVDVAQV
jgi:hypothetical protein